MTSVQNDLQREVAALLVESLNLDISPDTIDRAVEALIEDERADMSTTCEPITSIHRELLNGNVVKVLIDDNGYARHFSRSLFQSPPSKV